MKKLILTFTFVASCAVAQLGGPSLEQVKAAAEAGDPVAQDRYAERDTQNAESWYRKSAGQGYAHAQGRLGYILLWKCRNSYKSPAPERAAFGEEAVKWLTLAANQGDPGGQADLTTLYLKGDLVKPDLVEAYKWGDLAGQGSPTAAVTYAGRTTRDAAVLKMSADQIAEARRRVAGFKPHQAAKSELPTPAWVKLIKLTGISGGPSKRLATIGKETLAAGESGTVKVGGKSVAVKCLKITDTTATISIEGISGTQTFTLN